ncbi:MAG TPA: hypothetical protein VK508_19555 [Cyclobacteriaceae bacterium]|nr:hypothetical protein [Cyclobacteriaceae bacterium]
MEAAKSFQSYFEFKKTGDFLFYTDRRSEYDSLMGLTEELITPYKGTYTIKKKQLKIEFKWPLESTRTYLLVVINRATIKLIDNSSQR